MDEDDGFRLCCLGRFWFCELDERRFWGREWISSVEKASVIAELSSSSERSFGLISEVSDRRRSSRFRDFSMVSCFFTDFFDFVFDLRSTSSDGSGCEPRYGSFEMDELDEECL